MAVNFIDNRYRKIQQTSVVQLVFSLYLRYPLSAQYNMHNIIMIKNKLNMK